MNLWQYFEVVRDISARITSQFSQLGWYVRLFCEKSDNSADIWISKGLLFIRPKFPTFPARDFHEFIQFIIKRLLIVTISGSLRHRRKHSAHGTLDSLYHNTKSENLVSFDMNWYLIYQRCEGKSKANEIFSNFEIRLVRRPWGKFLVQQFFQSSYEFHEKKRRNSKWKIAEKCAAISLVSGTWEGGWSCKNYFRSRHNFHIMIVSMFS